VVPCRLRRADQTAAAGDRAAVALPVGAPRPDPSPPDRPSSGAAGRGAARNARPAGSDV